MYREPSGEIVSYENITDPAAEYIDEFYSTPGGNAYRSSSLQVNTIIPDAYEVSITLRELVPESQNTIGIPLYFSQKGPNPFPTPFP